MTGHFWEGIPCKKISKTHKNTFCHAQSYIIGCLAQRSNGLCKERNASLNCFSSQLLFTNKLNCFLNQLLFMNKLNVNKLQDCTQ